MKRRALLFAASGARLLAVKPPREPMPKFQGKTIDGESFTKDGLKGKVVLIQHWATWCGYCRKDEPAVERVIDDHGKDGLVVLAVSSESKAKVTEYLKAHPRSAKIVLMSDTNLGRIFAGAGVPSYLLMDRDGGVAAAQPGAGGLRALREMLSEVDLQP